MWKNMYYTKMAVYIMSQPPLGDMDALGFNTQGVDSVLIYQEDCGQCIPITLSVKSSHLLTLRACWIGYIELWHHLSRAGHVHPADRSP